MPSNLSWNGSVLLPVIPNFVLNLRMAFLLVIWLPFSSPTVPPIFHSPLFMRTSFALTSATRFASVVFQLLLLRNRWRRKSAPFVHPLSSSSLSLALLASLIRRAFVAISLIAANTPILSMIRLILINFPLVGARPPRWLTSYVALSIFSISYPAISLYSPNSTFAVFSCTEVLCERFGRRLGPSRDSPFVPLSVVRRARWASRIQIRIFTFRSSLLSP